jgi:hypothetical protein
MPTITEIDKQIAELEAQKMKIIKEEKNEALKVVEIALNKLNALGCSYSLVEATAPTKTRRKGVRVSVLNVIAKADGVTPAQIAEALGIDDKSGKNSISNALAALKASGHAKADNGIYRPA